MKIREPEYYSKFKCIADRCPDTCCRYWQVELDEGAFSTVCAHKNDSDFREVKVKGRRSNAVILPNKNGNCTFLEDSLLCGLYKKVGHDNLPRTCRLYPRFINTFGGYEERGLSFSCPAAAELIVENKLNFNETINEEPITSFTDVDAESFKTVKEVRDYLIDYISCSDLPLNELVSAILVYAKKTQYNLEKGQFSSAINLRITENYEPIYYSKKLFNKTVSLHLRNSILRNEWKSTLISSSYEIGYEDVSSFKTWFNYFIYRYLIRCADELDFLSVIKAAILSYFLISRLGEDQRLSMQLYSKETEHNQRNIERLFGFAKRTKI